MRMPTFEEFADLGASSSGCCSFVRGPHVLAIFAELLEEWSTLEALKALSSDSKQI
jgi:hypothetical protein